MMEIIGLPSSKLSLRSFLQSGGLHYHTFAVKAVESEVFLRA